MCVPLSMVLVNRRVVDLMPRGRIRVERRNIGRELGERIWMGIL